MRRCNERIVLKDKHAETYCQRNFGHDGEHSIRSDQPSTVRFIGFDDVSDYRRHVSTGQGQPPQVSTLPALPVMRPQNGQRDATRALSGLPVNQRPVDADDEP